MGSCSDSSFGFSRHMATTQFEATDARAAFPCFDEPEFKSQFIVTLVHEKDYKALSNMPVAKTLSRTDGFLESHFKETVKMSTYLLAFIVCDFAYKESHTKRGNKVLYVKIVVLFHFFSTQSVYKVTLQKRGYLIYLIKRRFQISVADGSKTTNKQRPRINAALNQKKA